MTVIQSPTHSMNFFPLGEKLAQEQSCTSSEHSEYLKGLKQQETSMFLHPTTHQEILTLINSLRNKSSSGYDNISNNL